MNLLEEPLSLDCYDDYDLVGLLVETEPGSLSNFMERRVDVYACIFEFNITRIFKIDYWKEKYIINTFYFIFFYYFNCISSCRAISFTKWT